MNQPSVDLTGGSLSEEVERLAGELTADSVASRIAEGDPSPWGQGSTAADGLGWVDLPRASRPLLGQISALQESFRVAGATRVVLVGTPGVTAGAEAIARDAGVALTVLDTADPGQVGDALAGDLTATVLVVADRAGDTPAGAPDGSAGAMVGSVARVLGDALAAEGVDPAQRTVVITEPGSVLDERARSAGATVITADRDVPDRFSALGPFGLVPAGLAGADVARVLADAAAATEELGRDDPVNPALRLAAALAASTGPLAVDATRGPDGLAEWVEQLITGSFAGQGPLPLLVEGPDAPGWSDAGTTVALGGPTALGSADPAGLTTAGPIGAQFVLWQCAVAAAGRLLDVDPFAAGTGPAPAPAGDPAGDAEPAFVDGTVAVHAGPWLPAGTGTVTEALRALVDLAGTGGHLVVAAWLDRIEDASAAVLRGELARRTGLTTRFGWAPRWRPDGRRDPDAPTGGVFCLLTGDAEEDVPVPGRPYGLAAVQRAQARAEAAALAGGGRPVLRLHLRDRVAGLVTVAKAIQEL
ncbi:glucose-6-phosphate isomerase [Pseudonocardia bannensis]|uniref:Glucose-6-phosphate isomerase n=1 Tax=Pseudonocardia bannensis TaxID=630973 RepID=A0A848DNK8_9PSEU|nr:glucose-6-phosphate isomerase [Pseudonocardia bannensis]NMH94332.1 glucose-6-phosphate isomerase [Pseudonocardia bannensis]